jgi:hypothetical protein
MLVYQPAAEVHKHRSLTVTALSIHYVTEP